MAILGLRFDNHVSLGHIVTTVAMIMSGLWWAAAADARITNLEKYSINLEKRIDAERDDRRYDMNEIKGLLKEIRDEMKGKMDK